MNISDPDKIKKLIRAAAKSGNFRAQLYYNQALTKQIRTSFSVFSRSWAYNEWIKKNAEILDSMKKNKFVVTC